MPSSPLPITITLAFGDSDNLIVASIPFSFKILSVRDALRILLALALPSASILCLSASCLAFSSLNSYSNASCSWLSFLSIAAFIEPGRVTSLTRTALICICWSSTAFTVSSKISFCIASLLVE